MNKGYTLAELCLVILIMSVFMNLTMMAKTSGINEFYLFPDAYLQAQSEALCRARETVFEDNEGNTVIFNSAGNVRRAGTIRFTAGSIVIELGGGRLVLR